MKLTADIICRVEKNHTLTPMVQRTPSYETEKGKDFFLMLTGTNNRYYFFKRQQALLEFQGNAATDPKSTYIAYDQCYLLLKAFKLKEALAESKLKGELKAVAEKLDEEDNPVVMIVEFNK